MRYSQFFLKTNKDAREFDSVNATLLQKGGFIHQTMAGVYTFLPLGLRVLNKIESIVREEMNKLGSELLMPALSPETAWQSTGRLDQIDVLFEVRGGNERSRKKNSARYLLSPTHEEIITPIAQQFKSSYKDLPFAVYQIQTKFRNEERPKSGLLRGREFRMKDLYSFHASVEDLEFFYNRVKDSYWTTFRRMGLGEGLVAVEAAGGDFTKTMTNEFQLLIETGEDIIYADLEKGIGYNAEFAPEEVKSKLAQHKTCEIGHIFTLGTKYSEAIGYTFADEAGHKKPVIMGSYGIGISRAMGVLVEKFHDEKGIIWPSQVAPFQVYLAELNANAHGVYEELTKAGIEVLYDDRKDASAGEKLADADLLGIPWRVVVSKKTGDKVEVKARSGKDMEMMSVEDFITKIS